MNASAESQAAGKYQGGAQAEPAPNNMDNVVDAEFETID
jgi:hypothetical protein